MKKYKIYILLIILFVLILSIFIVLIKFKNTVFFKVESKDSSIKESIKEDTDDYSTIGWLKVQGTNIDMPVLFAKNTNWNYPVTKEKYAWTLARDTSVDKKIDIMGHNIFNLSSQPKTSSSLYNKFEELMNFVYYDFAKENLYIQYSTKKGDFVYKIYSVQFIPVGYVNDYYYIDYLDEEDRRPKAMINNYIKESLFNYDVDVNNNDKFISLITCTRFFGDNNYDFIVNGRLLRENESIEEYDVKINKTNYKKVNDVLKGGSSNEDNV